MMTKTTQGWRTKNLLGIAGGMACLFLLGCTAQAGSQFEPNKTVALPGWQLAYENVNPMIKMATAWGDKDTAAHGTFGKFPPSFATPLHSHSGAYHGVVLSGVMTNPFEGEEKAPTLEPGSYWYVPAGAAHTTACVSKTPCSFYFHADSAFDFQPAE